MVPNGGQWGCSPPFNPPLVELVNARRRKNLAHFYHYLSLPLSLPREVLLQVIVNKTFTWLDLWHLDCRYLPYHGNLLDVIRFAY